MRFVAACVAIALVILATPARAGESPAVCLDRFPPVDPSGHCAPPPQLPFPNTPAVWVCPGGEGGFQLRMNAATIDIPTFCLHVEE